MNDAELDEKLKAGKEQARRFFNGQSARFNSDVTVDRCEKRRPLQRMRWKGRLAAVALLAAAALCVIINSGADKPMAQLVQPTVDSSQQTVYLSADKAYRMNAVPLDPANNHEGMMTVLWEVNGTGHEQLAYYSLFEACDTVYPLLTIPFPESKYDMLVIASGDSEKGNLGYRLVGFNGEALTAWWSDDFVPNGIVKLSNGVVTEHRIREEGGDTVTYIVPLQSNVPGSIALPVDRLRINVGEMIRLVGADGLTAASQCGLLYMEKQESGDFVSVLLKALHAGSETVMLNTGEEQRTLAVEISDQNSAKSELD